MRPDPLVRSVNPFPPADRIDRIMAFLSALAFLAAPLIFLKYGGRAVIIWLVGVLVVNVLQIVVWTAIELMTGGNKDEVA